MASIIPGYNYDIFISYRQKDNQPTQGYGWQSRGARWVSEFVDALNTELESTFKEDVSVYFDIDPHNLLLETHTVDKSIESKLRCLIFIPVISQTYCDPNSYAWQNELLAFLKMAEVDRFGKDIKLKSGNVASRILPVRIHDLEKDDARLFEKVTGGPLRAMDFVFRTASGVNRPLRVNEDHPMDNLNKTYFSDQLNKVAQAVKEIVQAMKEISSETGQEIYEPIKPVKEPEREFPGVVPDRSGKRIKSNLVTAIYAAMILIAASALLYPRVFRRHGPESPGSPEKSVSVAVMPFQNMTNDTIWDVWQDGIQDIVITYLSNSAGELKVKQPESITTLLHGKDLVNYASLTPSMASKISQKLEADYFVYGSIKQAGSTLRLSAQLIDSRTEEAFKSFEIEGTARESSVFQIADSMKKLVRNYLELVILEKSFPVIYKFSDITRSPEAYRYFIYGNKAFYSRDYMTAIDWYLKSLAVDSTFEYAAVYLSVACGIKGFYNEGKKSLMRIYDRRDKMPLHIRIAVDWTYAQYFETPHEQIKYLKQYLDIDDQGAFQFYLLGGSYSSLKQYDKAIPAYERSLQLYENWNCKPSWAPNYTGLGKAYHMTNQFSKEKELYKKAERDFPEDYGVLYRQAVLALSEGRTKQAENYISRYISIEQERAVKEPAIMNNLGTIYSDAGLPDKAEYYYRKSLSLEPGNPVWMNNLAWLLIDKERNIDEGLDLISKALEMTPDANYMLDTKGWGLYKKGKFQEALALLQKSMDLYPMFDYEVSLHLEAAKKAVAGEKN